MFDVGFSELLIIAVVALIVLGPERLPKAARFAGLWVRKARSQWYAVKSELEFELAQDEMKKHLQDVENSIKAPVLALQEDIAQAQSDIEQAVRVDPEMAAMQDAAQPVDSPSVEIDTEPNRQTEVQALDQAHDAETVVDETPSVPDPKQGALW